MGQYHYPCNLDRHEYIHPHRFGDGLKLLEFGCSSDGTMTGLAVLLACSNGRGGGDLHVPAGGDPDEMVGRWAGQRVAIIGDYAETGDIAGWDMQDTPSDSEEAWRDISREVIAVLQHDAYIKRSLTYQP